MCPFWYLLERVDGIGSRGSEVRDLALLLLPATAIRIGVVSFPVQMSNSAAKIHADLDCRERCIHFGWTVAGDAQRKWVFQLNAVTNQTHDKDGITELLDGYIPV